MDPATILFGLGVGLLVGITGMGGGSLMTPLLILVLGVKPVVAVGSDLAYAAITKTVGGWRHFTKGTVFPRMALWLAVGSCPAALAGVWVLDRLRDSIGEDFDTFMLLAIGGTLLLTGALVLLRALALADMAARERGAFRMQTRHKIAAAALGAVVGFVLGITSAGSGTLIAIGLILGFRLSPHRVVGTDVAHAAVLLWVAALAHVVSGNVDYGLAGTLLIGSIPGVWVGAHIATRMPQDLLRGALGVVLLASGLGLLSKAGLELPAFVLAGAPVVLAVVVFILLRRRVAGRGAVVTHLDQLEAEAVHVIREVAAELERPVLLFSGGKDSIVLLHLARKAFRPGAVPFPVMHVDTGHNFPEVIEFRDRHVPDVLVASVQESIDRGRVRDEPSRNRLQTTTLLDAIEEHRFDAAFGGARRDEERARAKERVFSFRDDSGSGIRGASVRSCGISITGGCGRVSMCACSRSRIGPSSMCGSTCALRGWSCRRSISRMSGRCSSATGCCMRCRISWRSTATGRSSPRCVTGRWGI